MTKYVFRYQDTHEVVGVPSNPNFGPWDSAAMALDGLNAEFGCTDPDKLLYYLSTIEGGTVSLLDGSVDYTDPEFLRLQSELGEHLKAMEKLWAEFQALYPPPEGRTWALNSDGKVITVSEYIEGFV